ncbi:hypothetical protein I3F58_03655 [Streptomyces sp. MUM 203J]|uniref:hypothetical protein n=1 Tax=Streptomyces sp. MUM 203J TaxID=2791990 RepID=UPI001F048C29|nr:hypothetical protein [Streptomyces sp. MUM 203J]MCH0538669.1 hypothetical protein [Streptomyces sp. MUM 203J]
MGIESDQLVFDYLSRVGDLAQQRHVPAKQRMNLVASLRDEIARQREDGTGTDTPGTVRRILDGLGTPDAVVTAVARGALNVPGQRTARTPRPASDAAFAMEGADLPSPRPEDQPVRDPLPEPEWWRVNGDMPETPPDPSLAPVPGFMGGVEIPEILEHPKKPEPEKKTEPPAADGPRFLPAFLKRRRAQLRAAPGEEPSDAPPPARRPALPRNPFLLLASVLLVVGVVLGSWPALAGGWAMAYASRKLSRAQAKWAVFGLPGLAAAGGAVWLWGRLDGRWGDQVPSGGEALSEALTATWPWVIRAAALASALYLLWRARRA